MAARPQDRRYNAMHPVDTHHCRVESLEKVTHDVIIMELALDSGEPFAFAAGQYMSLHFNGLPPRDFSLANLPGETPLVFHVRQVRGGSVGHHLDSQLRVGDQVAIKGPYGEAYLRLDHDGPIVTVAGSTGLAPIKSIVETALAEGVAQPIYLYFGVRSERDLYLGDHFEALAARHTNLTFVPALSHAKKPSPRRTGFIADVLAEDFRDHPERVKECRAYLAGPPVMVETARGALVALGVGADDCFVDPFYTDAEKAALDRTGLA